MEDAKLDVKMQTPTLLKVRQVSDGWIKKYELDYRLPSGATFTYESVSRKGFDAYKAELASMSQHAAHRGSPDAVCIVPRTQDDRLVMIREFRYPLNSWCIAFPAGLVDPGESIEATVERELAEETGYALYRDEHGNTHVRALSQPGFSSTGMSNESVQVVYAHVGNEPAHDQRLEGTENIHVFTLPMKDVDAFMQENTVPIGTRAQLILEAFARHQRRWGSA